MAYNKKNFLERVLTVQNITLEHKRCGVSQEWVYLNIIYPTYLISRTTYYSYLGCNAKAELKKIKAKGEQ